MTIPGGFGSPSEATQEVQEILQKVKAELEEKLQKSLTNLQALSYVTQVVAGVNYIMKVNCDDQIIHVKIHKPLPHTNMDPSVMAVAHEGITMDSPLQPFE